MGKKRSRELEGKDVPPADPNVDKMDEDDDDDEDFDVVNVDFEWFNYDQEVDFHGTKTLLRQLFDVDANLFNMSALADLVITQNTIGSTVKVDGKATDAYAMMTVLDLSQQKEPLPDVAKYIADKARATDALSPIAPLVTSGKRIGLILSERLINVPSEIAPPLYSMLVEEVEAAVEDGEPYDFSHYLILSKTYTEVESTLDDGDRKRKKAKETASTFFFHPEDEVLQRHAVAHGNFAYTKEDDSVADSKRAFQEMGVMPMGSMILIEASKFADAVKAVGEYLSPPS